MKSFEIISYNFDEQRIDFRVQYPLKNGYIIAKDIDLDATIYKMKLWDVQPDLYVFFQPTPKHGFDFADAYLVFNLPMVVELDARENYGEDRYIGIGLLQGRVVVVVYTEPDEQTIRIISLRKALSYERRYYEQYIED